MPPPRAASAEEESPITSRSPSTPPTARAKVDELLRSIQRIADSVAPDAPITDRVAVLRAAVQPIKLLGQLTGELGASDSTVAASPHYRRIRTAIISALKAHPEALRDVEAALAQLEPGGANTEKAA